MTDDDVKAMLADVEDVEKRVRDNYDAIPFEVRLAAHVRTLLAERDSLRTERESLRAGLWAAERASMRANNAVDQVAAEWRDKFKAAEAELTRLRERVEELEKQLEGAALPCFESNGKGGYRLNALGKRLIAEQQADAALLAEKGAAS